MRRTYRKNDFRELNRQIIIIGLLFMMSIVVGSYINKILPGSSNNILNNINPAVEYYNLNISIKDTAGFILFNILLLEPGNILFM